MSLGRPLKPLEVSRDVREQLEAFTRSRSMPRGFVQRAEIVLLCAQELTNGAVAKQVGVTRQTVGRWRERFRMQGLMGLYDEYRPGRPRSVEDDDFFNRLLDLGRRERVTAPSSQSQHPLR